MTNDKQELNKSVLNTLYFGGHLRSESPIVEQPNCDTYERDAMISLSKNMVDPFTKKPPKMLKFTNDLGYLTCLDAEDEKHKPDKDELMPEEALKLTESTENWDHITCIPDLDEDGLQ